MTEESAESSNLLGSFIRAQRQMANLSLRELAAMAEISNPYLSQIERGAVRAVRPCTEVDCRGAQPIGGGTVRAGRLDSPSPSPRRRRNRDRAIRTDPRLSEPQKRALLAVYRSYICAVTKRRTVPRASDVIISQTVHAAAATLVVAAALLISQPPAFACSVVTRRVILGYRLVSREIRSSEPNRRRAMKSSRAPERSSSRPVPGPGRDRREFHVHARSGRAVA